MDQFNNYYETNVNTQQQQFIMILFSQKNTKIILKQIYNDHKISLDEQRKLLNSLLITSYKMLIIITSFFIIFVSFGLYRYKTRIKWKHIIIENILMFISLGIFEYLFFINIILLYTQCIYTATIYIIYNYIYFYIYIKYMIYFIYILRYSPITYEEIKYEIANKLLLHFIGNSTYVL